MRDSNRARSLGTAFEETSGSQTRMMTARRAVLQRDVVVTGIGVILPNCVTRAELWRHLRDGCSQLAIEADAGDGKPCAVGRVRRFKCEEHLPEVPAARYATCAREQQFYLASVAGACRDAGLPLSEFASDRVGLFDGTSRGTFASLYDLFMEKLSSSPGSKFSLRELNLGALSGQAVGIAAAIFGVRGPTSTVNGTCASGMLAIGNAFREVQSGRVDLAFATGHDAALVAPFFQVYRDAGLISPETQDPSRAIRPYAGQLSNAFGEGAVTLVLEDREHAEARGAEILAQIGGFRSGNGGEHPTDVDFTGERPARLIEEVLEESELDAGGVDFVIGHGNGVQASDISELNYMKRIFGRRTRDVPLISTKPIYGHTLGASSALNVAAAALMLHGEYVVPTVGLDEGRIVQGFNHQANRGAARLLRSGLAVSYGAGGQNAALLLKKERG